MRWFSLLALATACGGGSDPAVSIQGGPHLLLSEGTELVANLSIANAPDDGECAPPFDPSDFTAAVDGAAEQLFRTLAIDGSQGSVRIVMEPRCDAVASGASDAIVSVTVATAADCARPAEALLQIADTLSAACAPQVTAWIGDCATEPSDASSTVRIESDPSPGPLCLRFASRDPVGDSLLVRLATSAPPGLIDVGDLPGGTAPFLDAQTFTVPLGDTTYILGTFLLGYEVYKGDDLGSGVLVRSGDIDLTVGEPGVAINAPSGMLDAVEFGASTFPIKVFRLQDSTGSPSGTLCARASRGDPGGNPLFRRKEFLRLEDATSGTSASEDEWVCGTDFRVTVSPPIDAPEVETLELSAAICVGCLAGNPVPTAEGTLAMRSIPVAVTSKADLAVCGASNPDDTDIVVACADIVGDDTPELVFRSANGSSDRACAFSGELDRLTRADWDLPSAMMVPEWMIAMRWRDPTMVPAKNMILAQFSAPAEIRRLEITDTPTPVASWVPATDLGIANADIDLRAAALLAENPGTGTTHLAYPVSGTDVQVRCIAASSIAGCSSHDLLIPNVAPAGNTIDHIARGDIEGDGDGDLLVYTIDASSPGVLSVVAIVVDWVSAGEVAVVSQELPLVTTVTGNTFRSGAIDRATCTMQPCPQSFFAVVTDPLDDVARMIRIRWNEMTDVLSWDTIPTLNAAFDVQSFAGRNIVGMQYGVAEAEPHQSGLFVDWVPQDPVIQEFVLSGTPVTPPIGYGLIVAFCRSATPSIAYTVDTAAAVFTQLDVDVVNP